MGDDPKPMTGQAIQSSAEVTTPETVATSGPTMTVKITAKGVLSALGIVKPGATAVIEPHQFSDNWMAPATKADMAVFKKWLKAQIPDAEG